MIRPPAVGRKGLLAAGVLLAACCGARGAEGLGHAGVTGEQVRAAIQKAVAHVRQAQNADGSWQDAGHPGGMTALCLLGLLHAGVPADDPAVVKGVAALGRVQNTATYVVSLKAQAYAVLNDPKYAKDLQAATDFLVRGQLPTGMWSYGQYRSGNRVINYAGRGDNSNTQFALLGLHEAAKAGAKVPKEVWDRASRHFVNSQSRDGGWNYMYYGNVQGRAATAYAKSYGSMTAAGLASLYICGQRLNVGGNRVFVNGAYADCGRYVQNKVIASAVKWLTDNFSVEENPGGRGKTWLHYYLYGLERCGMISGLRNFGPNDWYRQGAAFLVGSQGPDGTWSQVNMAAWQNNPRVLEQVRRAWAGRVSYDTVFALLFLAKGNRPLLIQKLQWRGDREPSWNRNIHDLENLTNFIDDKFGKRVTWQTATLDLSLQDLRAGPMLLITGHEFPKFTDAEVARLRAYVETGGTLLCEACCGSKEFTDGFRPFARRLMPEQRLRTLDQTHPVFRSYYKLDDLYDLEGIDVGCRTGVIFSPKALDCLWELQTIPKWSEKAFQIGTNIAAYATGKELLQDKLDVVELPVSPRGDKPVEVPRGAVRIARIIHEGDYKADVHAEEHLAALLREKARVDVVARGRHLHPSDDRIYEYPVVLMTGHYTFELPDKEIAALRQYLDRGGCLIADACCGKAAFDKSFRETVAKLYPDKPFQPLGASHPIYTGEIGLPLGEVRYRRILADELKARGTKTPPVEAVTVNGRTVILYSKYDFTCALEGDNPYSCRGYVDEDGRKIALNVFLYAIGY